MKMTKHINFQFKNLALLSNRDISLLLNETDNFTLICACQNCDPYILDRIAIQFCERGRNNFYDDLYKNANVSENQIFNAQERMCKMLGYLYFKKKLKDLKMNPAD